MRGRLLAIGFILVASAGLALAQVKTSTATETGRPLQAVVTCSAWTSRRTTECQSCLSRAVISMLC